MLATIDINYATYSIMSETYKEEYAFTLEYMKNPPETKDYFGSSDISDLEFIQVKNMQECMHTSDMEGLYSAISAIPDYSTEKFLKAKAYEVILTLRYICDRINEISQIEREMLRSCVSGDDYSALVEQVDFSPFPQYYTQLRELAGNDITKFEAIKHMKYSDCLVELIYRQKQSDFERLVMKQSARKN